MLVHFFAKILSFIASLCPSLSILSIASSCKIRMRNSLTLAALAVASVISAQNTATGTAAVAAAAATAKTSSPTSHVPGKAFDRIAIIWLENTDYDMAAGDREKNCFLFLYDD